MKSDTSPRNTRLAIAVLTRRILPALLLAPLLSLSAATFAADGRISFRGSITQSTCAVAPMPAAPLGHDRSQIIAPDVTVQTRTACGAQAVPFSTQYLPLAPTATARAGSGILTLTYQ
jgi:type 1 fimbria pilin